VERERVEWEGTMMEVRFGLGGGCLGLGLRRLILVGDVQGWKKVDVVEGVVLAGVIAWQSFQEKGCLFV